MNLYEINAALEETFYSCIDPETGEITGDTDRLDELGIAREEKIENTALMIKNLKAEADAIKAEEKCLSERRKACENRAEWLKNYLMKNLAGEKFKTPRVAISYRTSQIVKVDDVTKLPFEYIRVAEPEAKKSEIKAALKAGEIIEGAELVENTSMIIK